MSNQNTIPPDLQNENRLSINEAARLLNKSPSTIWRWCLSGVRDIRLENFSLGAARYTTQEALDRFSQRCTSAASGNSEAPQARTPRQRERDVESANRQLEKAGL